MDTQHLNNAPENGGTDSKYGKSAKAKKMAGKAAQYAGAAGLGAAGTMAANAINPHKEETDEVDKPEATDATAHNKPELDPEPAVTPEEFDPNDIMIEDVEEAEISDGNEDSSDIGDLAMADGPQPITGENIGREEALAMIDVDDWEIDSDPLYVSPDTIDEIVDGTLIQDPSSLMADLDPDPDILDDILNA